METYVMHHSVIVLVVLAMIVSAHIFDLAFSFAKFLKRKYARGRIIGIILAVIAIILAVFILRYAELYLRYNSYYFSDTAMIVFFVILTVYKIALCVVYSPLANELVTTQSKQHDDVPTSQESEMTTKHNPISKSE